MEVTEIADPIIGIVLLALGILLTIASIGLTVVLLKERLWWETILTSMLSMELPDLGLGGMQPMIQQMVQGMLTRGFIFAKLIITAGGAVLTVVSLGIALVGLGIWL